MLVNFGQDLRRLRESRRISIADISLKTKIHKSIIEKMENGDFSFFSEIHIRAFLIQYAKAIGVDRDDLLFNYGMAKNGRYSSMIKDVEEKEEEVKKAEDKIFYVVEPEIPPEIKEKKVEETPKEIPKETLRETPKETPKEKTDNDIFSFPSNPKKKPVEETKNTEPLITEQRPKTPERKPFSKSKRVKLENDDTDFNGTYTDRKGFYIPAHYFKNLGIAVLIIALLAGIYLLIDVVFLKKQNQNTEIIKQNFEDVVQENEKKILGKKTESEIKDSINKAQDSIRKAVIADSLKNLDSDLLTLRVEGLNKGRILVYTDTLFEGGGKLEEVTKDSKAEFKAKKQFYITSKNTANFDLYLNDKKLIIEDESIKNLKLTRKTLSNK
jgi:transcriptional regulator with XRE-family HTH domain